MKIENINSFKDFNNISIKVNIGRKKYNAIILAEDNRLILRIDILRDLKSWKKHVDKYELLTGETTYQNTKITFLDCECISKSFTGVEPILEATIDYLVDRIIFGKKITKQEYKNINKYEVVYNNIDCFTNNKPYNINYESFEYKGMLNNYDINLKERNISIVFSNSTIHSKDYLLIKRYTSVIFYHNKKINIAKVLDNIYSFRNFLMILLKKDIIVEKQFIYFGENKYQVFDCRDEILIKNNKELENHLNHRCLKIEKIKNLSEIYQKFLDNYDKLYPLLELYYNVTNYNVPNLTRFVNAITMMEYCSRTFDYNSALNITKSKSIKQSKVNDPVYKDMIISLINNVNAIYKFTNTEIEQIAENIKNARIYYIHYKNKSTVKKLTHDEQFWYSYFMQDIILLNIYIILDLDINLYEYISFVDFYYTKQNLL